MALRTNKHIAIVHVDPLSINSSIRVLSGNAVQVYDREIQEYKPDRTLVPLILLPEINVVDPEMVQNGKQELTAVEWYEGTPQSGKTNQIVAGADYEIGDGSVQGFPKYALKVKKNVDPNSPIEIFSIAVFTDKRRSTEVKVENNIKLYTAYYDALNYSLKIDVPSGYTIDPLQETANAEGYWLHTINAQLYSGKKVVADANAAYWWEIFENGAWRTINDDDLAIWIDCKDSQGNFTKSLTFDARLIDRDVSFRVRAAYYDKVKPSVPTSEELQATTSILMEMPKTLTASQIQTKGARAKSDFSTPMGYEVVLAYNKGVIPADKYKLFQIEWYAKSTKPGSSSLLLGYGKTVEFIPKEKGFDPKYPLTIDAIIKMYVGHALVTIKSKAPGETDSVLTVGGVPVIQPLYK